MTLFRRLLDLVGLAPYPENPRVSRRDALSVGVHCHVGSAHFAEVRAAGFDTVFLDWNPSELPPIDPTDDAYSAEGYDALFSAATAAGLKVFTGLQIDPTNVAATIARARQLFALHGKHITWCAVANEPDLSRFYSGTIEQLAEGIKAVWGEKVVRAPHVQIAAPNLSALHSSARLGWQDKGAVIRRLAALDVPRFLGVIAFHAYKRTPDMTTRYVKEQIRAYREAGWKQPVFVTETGFRSKDLGQKKQATYLVNTLAQLSEIPSLTGIGVYELLDAAPSGTYGLRRAEGGEKESWRRVKGALTI